VDEANTTTSPLADPGKSDAGPGSLVLNVTVGVIQEGWDWAIGRRRWLGRERGSGTGDRGAGDWRRNDAAAVKQFCPLGGQCC
jgi:hypothetical protein